MQGKKRISQRLREAGHAAPRLNAPVAVGDPMTCPPKTVIDSRPALAVWNRVVRILCEQGSFQETDRHALERYCIAQSICHQADEKLLAGGWSQKCASGYQQMSAEFSAFDKASRCCNSLEKLLGLSVEARRSLRLKEGDDAADELAEFLGAYGE